LYFSVTDGTERPVVGIRESRNMLSANGMRSLSGLSIGNVTIEDRQGSTSLSFPAGFAAVFAVDFRRGMHYNWVREFSMVLRGGRSS